MKKIALLILCLVLFGCQIEKEPKLIEDHEIGQIAGLVQDFGRRLSKVFLNSPSEVLQKSIRENYGDLVTEQLLQEWWNDLEKVPGRLTSSPYPERIEILVIQKLAEDEYEVKGEIAGDSMGLTPLTLTVKKIDNKWLITDIEEFILYQNDEYGFSFSLPKSWQGYQVLTEKWQGFSFADSAEQIIASGPLLQIRHPQWTKEEPYQDIPLMVFTIQQWTDLLQEKFHIGAAPQGPRELGRHAQYVFALPARYNYAFLPGYEEVESILAKEPLCPFFKNGVQGVENE